MILDGPVIVAFAALTGSLIGGGSSVAAAFIGQRVQARWSRLGAELREHETLYGEFVEEAVRLFVDAVQRSTSDPAQIMRLYSKVARIRLTSSEPVLRAGDVEGLGRSQGTWFTHRHLGSLTYFALASEERSASTGTPSGSIRGSRMAPDRSARYGAR